MAELNKKVRKINIVNPETGKKIATVNAVPEKKVTEFKQLSTRYVKQALDERWHGKNYSQRIWNNTDRLADRLQELFTAQQMSGMSEHDMAQAIEKEFGAGIYNAKRLIRTEANYFHNKTKLDNWKGRGVKEYQLVAVLDKRTSQICRHMDGKVFKVDNAEVGTDYPPFHPNCRTVAVIHFAASPYTGTRNANNSNTGKKFKISQDATYRDWERMINE